MGPGTRSGSFSWFFLSLNVPLKNFDQDWWLSWLKLHIGGYVMISGVRPRCVNSSQHFLSSVGVREWVHVANQLANSHWHTMLFVYMHILSVPECVAVTVQSFICVHVLGVCIYALTDWLDNWHVFASHNWPCIYLTKQQLKTASKMS